MAVIPNVITHGLMALDVYNKLEPSQVRDAIAKHPKAYLLGSNGPDILFYYKAFPWQNQKLNKKVALYGNAVHESNVNAFYKFALDTIHSISDPQRKDILISYISGHLMHWSLDCLTHPFIFYRSGRLEGETQFWHYRYESMIDSLMITYYKRRKMNKINIEEFVNVSQEECRAIASLYQMILQEIFSISTEAKVIEDAIKTMKPMLKVLFDPNNIRTPIVKKLEEKIAKPWAFSSHIVNSQLDSEHDILNLSRQTWSNPTDIDDTSNESFIDLYEKSIILGIEGIVAMNRALDNPNESLDELLKGRQYDTGRTEGLMMQYFDNIY